MKALISPNEPSGNGVRVAQVSKNSEIFEVGDPMFWFDCDDNCQADVYYFDLYLKKYFLIEPSEEQNKQTAINLLQQTDWTTISDVADPALANPYLANQAEFIAWRSQIRAIAIAPIAGNLNIFNQMPNEIWNSI